MNYYELLGVKETASKEEIKRAYVIKAQTNDNQPSQVMKQALLTLTDPLSRIQYDRTLTSTQSTSSVISLEKLRAMNYYDRLKINVYANQETVKKSYYEQIKVFSNELYPDHFILVREAYEVLSNPTERKKYSAQLDREQSTQSATQNQSNRSSHQIPSIPLAKLKSMNYFDRLNVNPYAAQEKIKESYYAQVKRFNNETFPEHFLLIKEAYEYLSDPTQRREYLIQLNLSSSNQNPTHQEIETIPDHYSSPVYTEESSGHPTLGWIIAILGSFMFTPVIAIPLGIAVGMGFARAFKAVGTLIVIGIILLFLIALFS
ncbi:DnaJ domain-containing protein [Exiguobacterium sp. SL-10]|uniref:J domain-containing protein n=1 Tax=Exiguobacterium sp. SL-10 TaxID=2510962 RepID=UPI00137552C9|nr:DnaJ domain-containing protein [Exiguobacterium sp. SL-10]